MTSCVYGLAPIYCADVDKPRLLWLDERLVLAWKVRILDYRDCRVHSLLASSQCLVEGLLGDFSHAMRKHMHIIHVPCALECSCVHM